MYFDQHLLVTDTFEDATSEGADHDSTSPGPNSTVYDVRARRDQTTLEGFTREKAQRNCRGIGRVHWLRWTCQLEPSLHHLLDLFFVGSTPTRDGLFDLVRGVFHHRTTMANRKRHGDSTHLPNGHCRANVHLEKDLLQSDCAWFEFSDQLFDIDMELCESRSSRLRGRCS
jgi:hypothetical protein